jgi:hypothetical protein
MDRWKVVRYRGFEHDASNWEEFQRKILKIRQAILRLCRWFLTSFAHPASKESLIKSHRGRSGCEATAGQANSQVNTAPGRLSPQPEARESGDAADFSVAQCCDFACFLNVISSPRGNAVHQCGSAPVVRPAINTHANFATGFRLHSALSLDGGGDDVLRHHRHADGGGLSGCDPAGGR